MRPSPDESPFTAPRMEVRRDAPPFEIVVGFAAVLLAFGLLLAVCLWIFGGGVEWWIFG